MRRDVGIATASCGDVLISTFLHFFKDSKHFRYAGWALDGLDFLRGTRMRARIFKDLASAPSVRANVEQRLLMSRQDQRNSRAALR